MDGKGAYIVNSRMCTTCIFTDRSPVSQARFEELRRTWEEKGVVQECHASTVKGEHVGCRGHYEAFKRGEFENHPLLAIAKEMGLEHLTPDNLAQVYERLGFIRFEVKEK